MTVLSYSVTQFGCLTRGHIEDLLKLDQAKRLPENSCQYALATWPRHPEVSWCKSMSSMDERSFESWDWL